jgi:hypothetical protein
MDPGRQPGDALGSAPLLNELKDNPSSTASQTQQQEARRTDYRTANGRYRSYLLRSLYGPLKFVLVFGTIAVLLAIPVMVINDDEVTTKAELGDIDAFNAQQTRQVVYYIFGWLLMSWLGLAVCFALGTTLPYIFRFIARYFVSRFPLIATSPTLTASQICQPGAYALLAYPAHPTTAHLHCRPCHLFVHQFCSCPSNAAP